MKKLIFGLILTPFVILGSITGAHAEDISIELDQCQRKALMSVQIEANKRFDTYVVLAKMKMIGDTGVADEVRYVVDVDIGSSDANHLVRYKAKVPSSRGRCIVDKPVKVKYLGQLF